MADHEHDPGIRLAELVAAFSLATDLGLGLPMEHVLRSWLIADRLADRVGLGDEARESLYYVVTLAWVGCVADTPEVAAWFGDDIAYRRDSFGIDRTGMPMMTYSLRRAGAGGSAMDRLRLGTALVVKAGAPLVQGFISHCVTTGRLAERLGLGDEVNDQLQHVFTRWDGKGVPADVEGEQIALPVRLFHLADTVEVLHRAGGIDAAVELARSWRGGQFDPAIVDVFCSSATEVLADLDVTDWGALIDREPHLQRRLGGDELDRALETFADFTDLRSPPRAGHSRAVADLAARAAELCGLTDGEVTRLRRGALLHDVGMHGLPATILDKPGPLTAAETERMRMHSYYTERMLARPPALADIGAVASLANERLDGSGYHRGLSSGAIPMVGRILAVADSFQAMTEPRPHRAAFSAKAAAAQLTAEVRDGRLAGDAVDAVLNAAGQRRGKRRSGPAGLTPRELEVLILIARGASTKQVARMLGITNKTAGTHIERIYTKIGASTRSTATLFAMQHGLLESLEPVDV
ncbi:MAG TPA: HD domain-containing phosphohydrolase [Actinomycetota bacterium]|nr:HD domain-containing phosphohydrolase [Actinomycetota bacterium]